MKTLIYKESLLEKIPIGITNRTLYIKEAENSVVDKLVEKYHYSHKHTKNRFKSFLVNDDKGFLQLGYGIRPQYISTYFQMVKEYIQYQCGTDIKLGQRYS